MKTIASAWIVLGSVVLVGCGSSGGGGSTASAPPAVEQDTEPFTEFTSFSEIELAAGETIKFPAVSRETSYTVDENGVSVIGDASEVEEGASVAFTASEGPNVYLEKEVLITARGTEIVFEAPESRRQVERNIDVGFDTGYDPFFSDPNDITGGSPYLMTFAERTDGTTDISVSNDREAVGWDYQNYGVWVTGLGGSSGAAGTVLFDGGYTAATDIPTTGDHTFTGLSAGTFVDNAGSSFLTASRMEATASFANRTVNFKTTNTHAAPTVETVGAVIARENHSYAAKAGLDLTGTMTYDAANELKGQVQTANGMKGDVDANFYGPDAAEIGGSFAVKGTAGNYIGAFGGKR